MYIWHQCVKLRRSARPTVASGTSGFESAEQTNRLHMRQYNTRWAKPGALLSFQKTWLALSLFFFFFSPFGPPSLTLRTSRACCFTWSKSTSSSHASCCWTPQTPCLSTLPYYCTNLGVRSGQISLTPTPILSYPIRKYIVSNLPNLPEPPFSFSSPNQQVLFTGMTSVA